LNPSVPLVRGLRQDGPVSSPRPIATPPPGPRSRLDRPIWYALNGPHAELAEHAVADDGTVLAARYAPDVTPFAAVGDVEDPAGWAALRTIVQSGARVVLMLRSDIVGGIRPWPPAGWQVVADIPGLQMVAQTMVPEVDGRAVQLDTGDVPEMLELVARTRPGPFEKRTIELGGYIGFRQEGRLVAMAGQRFATGGFTEISAVCTDADHRGRGLGARLVRSVAAGIVADHQVPFLHVAADNTAAVALYEKLGMCVRRSVRFVAVERVDDAT
jgi:ribosomal protein S18 acetylase RimI-like enzyme